MKHSGVSPSSFNARTQAQIEAALRGPVSVPASAPTPPRKLRHEESETQRDVITWWNLAHRGLGVSFQGLLYAVPNGGSRNPAEAGILKAEGVRSGVPDLALDFPAGRYHGMRIEMKSAKGIVSTEQKEFICELTRQGFYVRTCYSFEEAVGAITAYLRREV